MTGHSFKNGKASGIPRERVLESFGGFAHEERPDLWRIDYGSGNDCYVYLSISEDDPEAIFGAMVSRPVADPRLWDSLFAVMRLGNVALYYPGSGAVLIMSSEAIPHLPAKMVEALGGTVCIASGAEILERIRSS